ncbi:hypothetical protein [Croceitalea vernalis]|uniref:Uncharacterized protein n=1 Tax=Croceitalea vernalis TaxID=3075599 RepID=A0ABU3BKJ8_9FLAO|nr:hypothetical protein [Croceitalea sp. P007]MDT0622679.1 hypothetical protein [Croceitalea sp. P007]
MNKEEKNHSKDTKIVDSEFYGLLKNVYEIDGELIVEVDLIEIDEKSNINNQDLRIRKLTLAPSWGLERPKNSLFSGIKELQESKDIFIFKTNSDGKITRITKRE